MNKKYHHDTITHNTNAATELADEIIKIVQPKSLLDVGCGLGTWAKVFQEKGVESMGIDYFEVDRSLLAIDEKDFQAVDLEKGFDLGRKFDLIICLEVLEHLKESSSDVIVDSIVKHADTIVFSAAIPNQGGDNHVNEQEYAYWQKKFEERGYYFYDIFREKHWNNENIEWWYRQNMFLVSRIEYPFERSQNINLYIHPGLFEKKIEEIQRYYDGNFSVGTGFKFFIKTLRNLFRKK